MTALRWALVIASIVFVLVVLSQGVHPAGAHEWFPQTCCHDQDCYEALPGEVSVVPGGYRVQPDNIVIPFNDYKIYHDNPTPTFFICRTGKLVTNSPKCLFPPQPGS